MNRTQTFRSLPDNRLRLSSSALLFAHSIRAEFLIAAAIASLCTLMAAGILGYFSVPISIPSAYSGDGLYYSVLIKGVIENGWYLSNTQLGAPFGLDMGSFPMVDNTHFVLLWILGKVTGQFGATLTLFFLLSFATSALSAYAVMRLLGINRAFAAAGAFLFSLQAYHFSRGAHLFLASYFSVPIFVWIALKLHDLPPISSVRPRTALGMAAILAIASNCGIYYTLFGCLLIGFSGIAASLESTDWRPFRNCAIAGIVVLISVALNLIPNIESIRIHASDSSVTDRLPQESEILGLRLTQLALPSAIHRNANMRRISQVYGASAPNVNENSTASVGIVALVGFLGSSLALLLFFNRSKLRPLIRFGALNMVGFTFATVGGVGAAFAWLVTAQFRGLNRISIVLAFISICALLWGVQHFIGNIKTIGLRIAITALAATAIATVGFWDQVPSWSPHIAESNQIAYHSDALTGAAVMRVLAPGSRVYQVPHISFPEAATSFADQPYDFLRRYLHTSGIAWTFGAMRDQESDRWIRRMESIPLSLRLPRLAASGFNALLVERRAYADGGRQIEREIAAIAGSPSLICPDQSCSLFLLDSAKFPPVPPLLLGIPGSGFSDWGNEPVANYATWSLENRGSRIFLLNPLDESVKATLRFSVTPRNHSTIVATLNGKKLDSWTLAAQETAVFERTMDLPGKISTLFLTTTAAAERASPVDSRMISFLLSGLKIDPVPKQKHEAKMSEQQSESDVVFSETEVRGESL